MVYRYSWLAGIAALVLAFTQLNGLLRTTSEGVPWQFVILAAALLGAIITWAGLTYQLPGWVVILLNGVAIVIAVTRVASPDTSRFLFPTPETISVLEAQLDQAMAVIRSGIEPVIPLTGIVIVVMVVFWVTGVVLAWGLLRGHPYVALIPALVLTLQFATMNRGPSGLLLILVFIALVALTIMAIAADERAQTVGRMAPRGAWPSTRTAPPAASFAMLGVTVVASLFAVQTFQGSVPSDGILNWRDNRGLTGNYFGSISYNPFVSIQQSLVSNSQTPIFQARITGDLPPDQVYFQLVTMETYNGGQFFASSPEMFTLEDLPYEDDSQVFAGPAATVVAEIQIERLRQDWIPTTYSVAGVQADERLLRDLRVRRDDSAVRLDGGLTWEGMQYRIDASVPQPDLDVLATGPDGTLSVAFATADAQAPITGLDRSLIPTPTTAELVRDLPPDAGRYLDLPEDADARIDDIADLADERTANLETDFERAIALESWFHSADFRYTLLSEDDLGHGASDLAAWLLDSDSPNWHEGYCENFATAMAVMARTLDIPSRVVLGFTPGEPNQTDPDVVVIRDRNAHAWVELWMPAQGWVRFDPTPRNQRDTPQTFELANEELGFDVIPYLDVPDPDPLGRPGEFDGLGPDFGEEDEVPPLDFAFDDAPSGGGLRLPSWLTAAALWLGLAVVAIGGIPALKWWRRRRRMTRLRNGDISAAWEDIVGRLDDLGERVDPTATPREVADTVDPAMRPLATMYGQAIYGPEGTVTESHVSTATRSLEDTTMRLTTRYSTARRTLAWYRPGSILPKRLRRKRQ